MANITAMLNTPLCDHLCLCNMNLMALLVNTVTLCTIQRLFPLMSLSINMTRTSFIYHHIFLLFVLLPTITNRDPWTQNRCFFFFKLMPTTVNESALVIKWLSCPKIWISPGAAIIKMNSEFNYFL